MLNKNYETLSGESRDSQVQEILIKIKEAWMLSFLDPPNRYLLYINEYWYPILKDDLNELIILNYSGIPLKITRENCDSLPLMEKIFHHESVGSPLLNSFLPEYGNSHSEYYQCKKGDMKLGVVSDSILYFAQHDILPLVQNWASSPEAQRRRKFIVNSDM